MVNEGWIIFISYVNAYYKKTSARKILPTCGLGHKKFVWTDLSLCYLKLKTSGVGTNVFSRLLASKYNSIQSIFSNISSPFIFNHKNSSWVRIGSMVFVIALTIVKFVSDFIFWLDPLLIRIRVSQTNGINVQTGKCMLATSFSG